MRYSVGTFLLFAAGLFAWSTRHDLVARTTGSETGSVRVPVIVELFTSEGCSSCPPADALLAKLEGQQPFAGAEIIGLEEHVDYWDQLGWRDPFSSANWTARQYAYAGFFRNGSAYTPQMVVDGHEEFVGSRSGKARQAIELAAVEKKVKVDLSAISLVQDKNLTFKVSVENLSGSTDTREVMLAITETGLHSAVTRGENAGEDLHHASVLRELKTIGAMEKNAERPFSAQPVVKLDSGWKRENLRVVIFVQEKKGKRILGAAAMRIVQ